MSEPAELPEISNETNIALEVTKEIIDKAVDLMYDISELEFSLKYDPTLNPEEPYMKRKLSQIRNDVLNTFGSTSLELTKRYSKLELEKIKIKNKLSSEEITKEDVRNMKNSKIIHNQTIQSDFMSDAKIHKSKIEQDKEKIQTMIGQKRKNNEEATIPCQSGDAENWTSLMANSLKKKSKIEIEKEKFLEETKKRKEEQLKNSTNLMKSQVFKFEGQITEKKLTGISKNDSKIRSINETGSLVDKICQVCKESINIKSNCKKISARCEHYLHYVKYLLKNNF